MKRVPLWLMLAIVLVGAVVFFTLRQRRTTSSKAVATLLAPNTGLLIHIPDTQKNAEEWHRTDIYQLCREPAVQELLQQPNMALSKQPSLLQAWHDYSSLRPRDSFVATTSFDPFQLVAGLQFRCTPKQARVTLEEWKNSWLAKSPRAQRSSRQHGKYQIDIISSQQLTISSVITGDRVFAATHVEDLEALLDRNDTSGNSGSLAQDAAFLESTKQMPAEYALMFYLRPEQLLRKLTNSPAANQVQQTSGEGRLLERLHSFSDAVKFEKRNIREVGFAATPEFVQGKLNRDTLGFASTDTLLYLGAIFNLDQYIDLLLSPAGISTTAQPIKTFVNALSAAGVSAEDWKAAFGNQISIRLEWPASDRIPSVIATIELRDPGRAQNLADAWANAMGWSASKRDSVTLYTAPPSLLSGAVHPVVAISPRMLVLGFDTSKAISAASGQMPGKPLVNAPSFRQVVEKVPEPQQSFVYLDLPTLYSRLDTTLRPILQMSAAFVPSMRDQIDPAKLPSAAVVSKHLSPVVGSQSYVGTGYRSESIGPITIGQTIASIAAVYAVMLVRQKHNTPPTAPSLPITPSPVAPAVVPSPTP